MLVNAEDPGLSLALKEFPGWGRQTFPSPVVVRTETEGKKFWAEGAGAKAKHCLGELGLMQEGTCLLGFEE